MDSMKTPKILVPKSRIPKVHPVCVKCSGPTKAVFGTAFAEGYHRRHVCCDSACGASLYSLASYESPVVQYMTKPFKDRALTELEMFKRDQWWDEEANYQVTTEVTPLDVPARIREALGKEESKRNPIDQYLIKKHDEVLTYLRNTIEMELKYDEQV